MHLNRPAAFAAGVFATLVLGAGTAVAANGGSLVLGHNNAETAATTLTNTHGTALALKAKAGHAPLTVNNTTEVKHLNADLLDGKSASDFVAMKGHTRTDYLNVIYTGSLATPSVIAASNLAPVTVPAGAYLVSAYVDFYNPEATIGDYGCYPRFATGAVSSNGRYIDATVSRYSSSSSQQVRVFTGPTTISLTCFVYTGDADNLAKIELAEITASRVLIGNPAPGATTAGTTSTKR